MTNRDPYLQALDDLEELLDNAKANGGGIDAGNGKFVENAHWDFEIRDQIIALRDQRVVREDPLFEIADYVTQDYFHNRLTPRIVDVAYTAFMNSFKPNPDDGGATDWFNDTKPLVMKMISEIRKDMELEDVKDPR